MKKPAIKKRSDENGLFSKCGALLNTTVVYRDLEDAFFQEMSLGLSNGRFIIVLRIRIFFISLPVDKNRFVFTGQLFLRPRRNVSKWITTDPAH